MAISGTGSESDAVPREGELYESGLSANAGWLAGGLVILGVLLVGLGFWLKYHG